MHLARVSSGSTAQCITLHRDNQEPDVAEHPVRRAASILHRTQPPDLRSPHRSRSENGRRPRHRSSPRQGPPWSIGDTRPTVFEPFNFSSDNRLVSTRVLPLRTGSSFLKQALYPSDGHHAGHPGTLDRGTEGRPETCGFCCFPACHQAQPNKSEETHHDPGFSDRFRRRMSVNSSNNEQDHNSVSKC
ncbi:hypothetical protein BO70DRAFT_193545 [Aspergillus heteromorphus CBS 117.55]|uniref:Uncharacterized protein n=1 Tax=Aspergillus heteromorphus CBS 117.55 TaxID=1448321 RepID=A0A317WQ24_9EURO|nr:uncharacterized protein BO70DRAFT_193545 [Aspergillus heteromorphus CBS 117.55]PWY87382.1 hypothetical protein BO70DRAFT_193545 [Aspergillus heteromorphus CBS 117.55]